ncbi:MAG: hypothetical protein R2809_11945 [Flavobacteriales bacterium]
MLFSLLSFLMMISFTASAESTFEEYFYASGKIRVVIAVAAIVLTGLITYVIILDRKVKKLENRK